MLAVSIILNMERQFMKAIAGYMIGAEIMIAAISGGIISALVLCPGFPEALLR